MEVTPLEKSVTPNHRKSAMVNRLSDIDVKNAQPAEKNIRLYDGGGLFLLVTTTGGKMWRFKYRFGGKEKSLSLGTYPKISLTVARSLRDNARPQLIQGVDPSAARKAKSGGEGMRSVRYIMDGTIELWKGAIVMCLSTDEAQFIAKQLSALTRSDHGS